MATRRVLIVDDEPDIRKTLTDILRAMRYPDALEIETAPGGQEGLAAVVRQPPDLVLMDLQMPRMDGLTLLKMIRDAEPRLPIVVITATDDPKTSAEAPGRRGRVPAQAVRSTPRGDARHHVPRYREACRREEIAGPALRLARASRAVCTICA